MERVDGREKVEATKSYARSAFPGWVERFQASGRTKRENKIEKDRERIKKKTHPADRRSCATNPTEIRYRKLFLSSLRRSANRVIISSKVDNVDTITTSAEWEIALPFASSRALPPAPWSSRDSESPLLYSQMTTTMHPSEETLTIVRGAF